RSEDGAREELERSLERLGVDRVDLIQLHNLVEEDEWEQAHSTGGALEALVRARDEGLASAVGVTGHGLRIAGMHLRSLNRFDYDSVLLPCNFLLLQDRRYRSDFEELLTLCTERTVAVQLIKSIARRRWPGPGERSGEAAPGGTDSPGRGDPHGGERLSWYEPLVDQAAIDHAVHYVLGRGEVFLVTSSDFRRLASTLDAAEAAPATPPDDVLSSEARELAMSALFDGADLERI
ncbi:MAG: aldo/keto reductase, partial [Acidimicrobiales bacterium]